MTTRQTQRAGFALRHCGVLLSTLWACVLMAAPVAAQQYDPQLPPVPPAPDAVRVASDPVAAAPAVVRGPCDPDYWIVSTRNCYKEIECGQACPYEVLRFDGANPARSTNVDELLASLQPGVPVCFMVHGSFVTWESMLNDSARTYHWLRQANPCRPIHIIFYTWASDDGQCFTHLKVHKFGRRASQNGFYLADMINKVSADHPICLIGHSHGTRMVSAALHSLAGGTVDGRMLASGAQPARHIRVVLAAAAIDHDWLNPNERFGLALCQAEAVVNLRNRHDFPLVFYPLRRPFSKRALAVTGLTRSDHADLGDENQKIVDYDVTSLVELGHIWAYYYKRPEIAAAIRPYVYFDE